MKSERYMETKVVEVIKKDRTAFKDTDGVWWNSKYNPLDPSINKGDTVEFAMKPGTTFVKGAIRKTGGAATPPTTAGGGSTGFPAGLKVSKDVAIIRQNALSHATKALTSQPDWDEVPMEDMAPRIIMIASELEKYTTGELDTEALEEFVPPGTGGDGTPEF
jgi:hypothetical protein